MDVGYTKPQGDVSENRRASIFGVGIGFIVFDSIVISLRFYVRGFMLRALGTDDIKSTKGNLRLKTNNHKVLMIIGAVSNLSQLR